MKECLPRERAAITHKMRLGKLKAYVTVCLYDDGRPGEMFIRVDKSGSLERCLCHSLALMISLALQRGVPVKEIADKLTGLHCEPRGVTGNREIPIVSSLSDYIGKWLTLRFCQEVKQDAV